MDFVAVFEVRLEISAKVDRREEHATQVETPMGRPVSQVVSTEDIYCVR